MKQLKNCLAVLLSVFLLPSLLLAQQQTISGKITDVKGAPIYGANVSVKQSTKSTATDADGKFALQAEPNVELIITSAGYKSVTVKASADVQVKMEEDFAKLDEIIVTGLATSVKRRNLANAVSTISSKQLNGVAPAQTLDGAINGKIPGAYINANSGAPGGGTTVKLRGVTSVFGNTQPLYVVDGVFVDNTATSAGLNAVTGAAGGGALTSNQDNPSSRIADIRAEDIDNVEILKGASAAAIYGSKAAAGVIIITTRRGKQGATKISVSQDLGQISARKLLGVRNFTAEKAAGLSRDPAASAALAQQFTAAQSAGKIYDYEKEVYGNKGFARNTVLSISGGNEKTGFYFSAATKNEDGIVKNTGYENSSVRLNIDHKINDRIKIGVSTNYIN